MNESIFPGSFGGRMFPDRNHEITNEEAEKLQNKLASSGKEKFLGDGTFFDKEQVEQYLANNKGEYLKITEGEDENGARKLILGVVDAKGKDVAQTKIELGWP